MGIPHKKISGNTLLFFNVHQTAPENPIVHLWRGGKTWLLMLQTNICKEYIHPGPHFNPHYESINHAFMFQLIGCSRQETRSSINIIFLYLKLLHKVLLKHVKCHKMSSQWHRIGSLVQFKIKLNGSEGGFRHYLTALQRKRFFLRN